MSYSRIYGRAFAFDSAPLESLEAQCFLEVSDSKHHPKLETARDPKSKNEGISLSCSHKQITFFSLPVPHDAIAFEFAVHESSQPKPFLHWLNDTQQFLLRIRQMGQHLFFRVSKTQRTAREQNCLVDVGGLKLQWKCFGITVKPSKPSSPSRWRFWLHLRGLHDCLFVSLSHTSTTRQPKAAAQLRKSKRWISKLTIYIYRY